MATEDIRLIRFSSSEFKGFTCDIDVHDKSLVDIENEAIYRLYTVLVMNNFENLVEKLGNTIFHIHMSLETVRSLRPTEPIYMCDCVKLNYPSQLLPMFTQEKS